MGIDGEKPPSAFWRGVVALALLLGFYALTLGLAIALALSSVAFIWLDAHRKDGHSNAQVYVILVAITWIPAFVLVRAMFVRVRRPPLGARLARSDAPLLFALIDELAARVGTRPPDDVYIAAGARVGVTEVGGFLGFGSRRVLLLGAQMVAALDVSELRSALAHELGHYLGGETRFNGVATYTHALFASLLEASAREPTANREGVYAHAGQSVARSLVGWVGRNYARFYGRVTRPTARRLEHAADALSARLVGRDVAMRTLEKAHLVLAIHRAYDELMFAMVIQYQALPADLVAGFAQFRKRIDERGLTAQIDAANRAAKTEPLDTHPALNDRLDFLMLFPAQEAEDRRPASDLIEPGALERWTLAAAQTYLVDPQLMRVVPWADFPAQVLGPAHARRCGELVASMRIHPSAVATFVFAVEELARGNAVGVVVRAIPKLGQLAPFDRNRAAEVLIDGLVGDLFVGALLESGGAIRLELGEGSFFVDHAGRTVKPLVMVADAKKSPAAFESLREWSALLSAPRSSEPRASAPG